MCYNDRVEADQVIILEERVVIMESLQKYFTDSLNKNMSASK